MNSACCDSAKSVPTMLRRAKSFMVKSDRQKRHEEPELELSETAHLRRTFVPQAPIYERIGTEKPRVLPEINPKDLQRNHNSFRGLRRRISISLDNVVRNNFVSSRNTRRNAIATPEMTKSGTGVRRIEVNGNGPKGFNNRETERFVREVQHNNASRLRMNQVKKTQASDKIK